MAVISSYPQQELWLVTMCCKAYVISLDQVIVPHARFTALGGVAPTQPVRSKTRLSRGHARRKRNVCLEAISPGLHVKILRVVRACEYGAWETDA